MCDFRIIYTESIQGRWWMSLAIGVSNKALVQKMVLGGRVE